MQSPITWVQATVWNMSSTDLTFSNYEIHFVIKFLFAEGIIGCKIHCRLCVVHGEGNVINVSKHLPLDI